MIYVPTNSKRPFEKAKAKMKNQQLCCVVGIKIIKLTKIEQKKLMQIFLPLQHYILLIVWTEFYSYELCTIYRFRVMTQLAPFSISLQPV